MAGTLTARDGDTLDGLLWRDRGLGPSALPAVLSINPGVAAAGAILPTGTVIVLPDLPRAAEPPMLDLVQLWT